MKKQPKTIERCAVATAPDLKRILLVDDEQISRDLMHDVIGQIPGIKVLPAGGVDEAITLIDREPCRVIVTDLKMPGRNGLDLLAAALDRDPLTQVIVVSAKGGISDAVEAMKVGAFDYLVKPFQGEDLRVAVEKALRQYALLARQRGLELELDSHPYYTEIIGSSPVMETVRGFITRAAAVDSTLTILGETGTGKELVARLIHRRSTRCAEPFVAVNCGAMPAELVESELFGHSRGAFTGAVKDKEGRFEQAAGGTLFLDEVGELPLQAQVKLLRVLESRTFERIGGTRPITSRARVIAATHRDLKEAIAAGTFREDLYYRLWVVPFAVPPLRERGEDIPLLAEFFARQISHLPPDVPPLIAPGASKVLRGYSWPGNVRELRNVVERAIFHSGTFPLTAESVAFLQSERRIQSRSSSGSMISVPCGAPLGEIEKLVLERTYRFCEDDPRRTAETLQVSRSWVYEKLKAFEIRKETIQKLD